MRKERFGPRTIDLDLLLYGQEQIALSELGSRADCAASRACTRGFLCWNLWRKSRRWPCILALRSSVYDLLQRARATPAQGRELAGLRALVTGSTSGIGKAIAPGVGSGRRGHCHPRAFPRSCGQDGQPGTGARREGRHDPGRSARRGWLSGIAGKRLARRCGHLGQQCWGRHADV